MPFCYIHEVRVTLYKKKITNHTSRAQSPKKLDASTYFSMLKYLLLKKVLESWMNISLTLSAKPELYTVSFTVIGFTARQIFFFFFQLHLINAWLGASTTYEFFLWYINAPTWLSLYTAYVSVCVLFCSAEHRILWFMTVSARFLSHGPAPCHTLHEYCPRLYKDVTSLWIRHFPPFLFCFS